MAPEQIEGAETDARTDVFAFAAMLFEMITGRKAFAALDRRSLMVAILDREPAEWSALRALAPQWLEELVRRCIAKSPDDRWQSARDILLELRAPHAPSPVAHLSASTDEKRAVTSHPNRLWAAAAALVLVAVIDHHAGNHVIQTLSYPGRPHGVDRALP